MARIIAVLAILTAAFTVAHAATVDPIVGKWMWGTRAAEVMADHTATREFGTTGTWKFLEEGGSERTYQFSWENGRLTDDVSLSEDRKTADIRSSLDEKYKATRIGAVPAAALPASGAGAPAAANSKVARAQNERTAKYVKELEALMRLLLEAKTPEFYKAVKAEHDAYADGGKTEGYPRSVSVPGTARILRNGFEADLAAIEKNGGAAQKPAGAATPSSTADPFDITTGAGSSAKPPISPAALASNPKRGTGANVGTRARYVRIELPRKGILSLAEVQVFSGGKNVAPSGVATQSSTNHGGDARLAIDGNTDGRFIDGSITHTAEEDDRPWWEVDLGREVPIEAVTVWNRTEDGPSVAARLDGFTLTLLAPDRQEAFRKTLIPAPAESVTIPTLAGMPGSKGLMPAAPQAPREAISSLLPNRDPLGGASSGLSGRFYVNIDDDVWLFVNGVQIFHNSAVGRAQSPVTHLKVGDRVTARLLNRGGDRCFALAFMSLDRSKIVSFRHTDFKILPDSEAKDFTASGLASITGVSKEDRGRAKQTLSIFPFRHHSESVWGQFDECCLACVVTPAMITTGTALAPGAAPPTLEIIDAKFGQPGRMIDVTEQIRSRIFDNALHMSPGWRIDPDPAFGLPKDLVIHYRFGATEKTVTVSHDSTAVEIP